MAIELAKYMLDYAVSFDIGASILKKGGREVSSSFSASNATGDTVNVPIYGSGKVYDKMDISDQKGKMGGDRAMVPVKVTPLVTGGECTSMQLTLEMKRKDIMAKRVALLVDKANHRAWDAILGGSQAYVASAKTADAIGEAIGDAHAQTEECGYAGSTFAMATPTTYQRIVNALGDKWGGSSEGKHLFAGTIGNFMGINWGKGARVQRVTGVNQGFSTITANSTGGSSSGTSGSVTGSYDGELSQPVKITHVDTNSNTHKIYCVDCFGRSNGIEKTIYLKWDSANSRWDFASPIFFTGPRKNAHCDAWVEGTTTSLALTCTDVLTANTVYMSPTIMWKDTDLLIALKGIEPMESKPSYTIPIEFKEKGPLPLRGTLDGDAYASSELMRVDTMLGYALYQGVSATGLYIPA